MKEPAQPPVVPKPGAMLRFVDRDQAYPDKRPADERRQDFAEIARGYARHRAAEQAARCSQCGVPFCQIHCPLHNHIPDWLMLAAEGRLREAHELASSTSTMPEICGRICPQDRLCEGNCVIEQSGHGAVTIGAIETFITDTAWEEGWIEPVVPRADRSDQSVGIVGAGPAGLTVAELLRGHGYRVDVYDRHDRAGGLLVYGIPGFKLEKHVVARRVKRLEEGGIHFHLSTEIGRDLSFADVRRRHDAVVIATGVYAARPLGLAADEPAGVVEALDYLIRSNRLGLGDDVADEGLDAAGRDVVVIGGGDTAMDCVRTAVRQGARSVTCVYRRDRRNMPGSPREVAHAEEEGVRFCWLAAPDALEAGPDGRVEAVVVRSMRLGAPDATGRQVPVPGQAVERLPADMVVKALGFDPEPLPALFGEPGLEVTRWGTVRVEQPGFRTSLPGVFAVGDIVRGASLVVWAIREARDAVPAIHAWLQAAAAERRAAA